MQRRQVRLPSGRGLSAVTVGDGPPEVVFLAGFMAGASEWSAVQRLLGPGVPSVSYDRAGYGGSTDPDSAPTEASTMDDLLRLMDALEVTVPAVFVAHSWGGTVLRLLAREHPERIAAACLVDVTRAGLISPAQMRAQGVALRLMAALSPIGASSRVFRRLLAPGLEGMDPLERDAFLRDSSSRRTLRAGIAEKQAMADSGLRLLADLEAVGLPDIPVTWLVGRNSETGGRRARAGMLAGHERECRTHPRGRFVVAERSGHLVPQQEPELVASEVRDLRVGRDRA